MTTRSPSNHSNHNARPPLPLLQHPNDHHHHHYDTRNQPSFSNLTSANTSRQTSSASIHSMPFNPISRHSTPPTPLSSPGLFRPPSNQLLTPGHDGSADSQQFLHPSQYRQAEQPVRETHQLETDYDPMTGRKIINEYSIIDEIGRGTHGKVKLGYDMRTSDLVAIKIVERSQGRPRLGRKGDGGESSETKIRREIAILKKIRHDNVVRLLEVIDDDRSKKVYLVLEYVVRGEVVWRQPGDPDAIRRDRQRLKREIAAARAKEAAAANNGGTHKSRAKRKRSSKTSFWSLEFASDSDRESDAEDDGDQSDAESVVSLCEDDCYVPAMEIEEARKCFRDTVVGLDHLHWNGIIHRDIKPANLLWTDNKVTKISDFGVSFLGRPMRSNDDDGTGEDEPTGYEQDELELAKTAGTPAFFAPELCSMEAAAAKVPITSAIDVWALGVTLFSFIYGRLPFMADNEFQLFKCIAEEELVIPRRRLRAHKPPLDPSHRLTPEELEEYESEPVDDDLRDLIKRLLTKNPSKRILLKEVKRHPWVLQGIQDPIHWVEKTDPDLASHGNKIEVTAAEVETAISIPSVVNRIRRAASTWVKGLRKRASSTANMKDKGKQSDASGKQGQKSFFNSPKEDDLDKELQWMGGIQEPREEEKLNELAPSVTNSSTASSETVQPEYHDQQWTDGNQMTAGSPPTDKKLRRKQSMGLLGTNLLRRHSVTHDPVRIVRSTHRAPLEPPPVSPADDNHHNIFKAESTSALAAPTISRMIRNVRSDDNGRRFGRKPSVQEESGTTLTAREVLSEALYHRNPGSDADTLPTFTPQPRSLYKPIDGIENGMLNIFPKIPDPNMKQKVDRHRREEQEQARLRLGKMNLDDDLLDQPCPTSPDDEVPPEQLVGQENRRLLLEERERQRYTSAHHGESLHFRTPEGWSRESFYHPARDWATPPIAMVRGRGGYFDPPSPKNHIPSSSSDERFVTTTAGSSLTNSTSFPSIATDPSSVSSDMFLAHYHPRKESFVLPDEMEEDPHHHPQRERKQSELLFPHDYDDDSRNSSCDDSASSSDSDSEGGFVMRSSRSRSTARMKRSNSVMVAEVARASSEAKDRAIVRAERRRRPLHAVAAAAVRRSGSKGTVTSASSTEAGAEGKTG